MRVSALCRRRVIAPAFHPPGEGIHMPQNLLTDAKVRKREAAREALQAGETVATSSCWWNLTGRGNGDGGSALADKENVLYAAGTFPGMGLAEARKARDAARDLVAKGINPAHQRQEEQRQNIAAAEAQRRDAEGAFAKVAEAWLAEGKSKWAPGTYLRKMRGVKRNVLPALGSLSITQIGPAEIRALLEACRKGRCWAGAVVKGDLSAIFDYAVVHGLVDTNPVPGLRALVHIPQCESKAALTLPQLREFFTKLRPYHGYPETAMSLRFIALTACWPARPPTPNGQNSTFDANLWRRPAAKMKARREYVFPLSDASPGTTGELRVITGGGRYLFPHRDSPTTFATTARLRYLMRDLNIAKGASPTAGARPSAHGQTKRPSARRHREAARPRRVQQGARDLQQGDAGGRPPQDHAGMGRIPGHGRGGERDSIAARGVGKAR